MASTVTRSGPASTREELLSRAAALMPVLADRAASAEQLRQVPPETVRDLHASELVRIGNPDRYGGLGAGWDLMYEVGAELGRGCGSTAWCYSVWTLHNWIVGYFPIAGQEAFYAGGPDVLCSSAYNSAHAGAERVAGGYRVSGRWEFSSGCDAAGWAMLGLPDCWALVPRQHYEIVDTWYVSGLRATGSKDIVIRDAFVPDERTLVPERAGQDDLTGWEFHRQTSYRVPLRMLIGWDLVPPMLGIAQSAVDEFVRKLRGRTGPGRTADSTALQLRLAEASAEVDAARLILLNSVRALLAKPERGEPFSDLDRFRSQRDRGFIARLCVHAVDTLFAGSGGHALYDAERMQRLQRDMHAIAQHGVFSWDAHAAAYGSKVLHG